MKLSIVGNLALALHLAAGLAASDCEPSDPKFVYGLTNAEDVVRLSGTPWIVASHVNPRFIHLMLRGFGPVEAVRMDTHEVRRLYPTSESTIDWDRKSYPDCAAPPKSISSHGLNVRPLGAKKFRLYVANHGERQSVEVIDVAIRGERLLTTWRGCIRAPEGLFPNGVAPLPGGGVALSGFGVAVWRPGRGWTRVGDFKGSNGLEVSRDGQWIFVAIPFDNTVVRVAVEGGAKQRVLQFAFHPDNLRWGEDGRLYVAGPHWPEGFPIKECLEKSICDVGFAVAQIDPDTLTSKEILRSEGIKGAFGAATTALQVDDHLWIGSSRGDRLAIFPLKP